jgi:hypothetical protein
MYPIGSFIDFPDRLIRKGVIIDSLFHEGQWVYHIKYNEKIVGEALKADHAFLLHDELTERGTVHVISTAQR